MNIPYSSSGRGLNQPYSSLPPNMPHNNMPPPNMPPNYMNPNHMPPPNMPPPNMPPNNMSNSNRPPNNTYADNQPPENVIPMQPTVPGEKQQLKSSQGDSFFAELKDLTQVDIRQDASCIDCCLPMCTENVFNVFMPNSEQKLYEFKEDSGCLERCCCYKCHSFKMKIHNFVNEKNSASVIMEGEKEFSCGILCNCLGCGKPYLSVEVKSPQGLILGKTSMNYSCCCCACCSSKIEIVDNTGIAKYIVKGSCCFPVGCFCGPCAKCCSCSFGVNKDSQEVGVIKKNCCSSCRTWCTKATDYTINFPEEATPQEKMLIIIASILIDSQNFFL